MTNKQKIGRIGLRILEKMVFRLSSFSPSETRRALYHFLARLKNVPEAGSIRPGDGSAREALGFWFALQDFVNGQISNVCSSYYGGRHPKHYLWPSHNQYLYDGVSPGDRVLDIGCGVSHYQLWIAEKAAEVLCIDIDPDNIEQSRRNSHRDNVNFEVWDAAAELPEGFFDAVICSHVLEHLDDPVDLLRRLRDKTDKLLIKVPLIDAHWHKAVKRDLGLFAYDSTDHRREYTENMLESQLTASGWQVIDMIRGYDLRATAIPKTGPKRWDENHD